MALVEIPDVPQFPKYTYTFKVINTLFESAQIEVEYIPEDTRLLKLRYCLPLLPDFDPANLTTYVETWAPYDKWFAQDMILQHGSNLIGAGS